MKPLCVDLFCGLGGWADGFLAENYDVIGFDIERHVYGEHRYPAQLVLQDVLTLHGSQFRDASLIVASPPCQEFSYMAMPWSKAKEKARRLREGTAEDRARLTALFDACFRIQREAIEAAGHFIPLVVENVRGACEWVGRSRWNYGSFHLWGDVPALMPIVTKRRMKFPADCGPRMWSEREYVRLNDGNASAFHQEGTKNNGATVNSPAKRGKWKGNAFPHELVGRKHEFVGGYEIDPSQPSICQICGTAYSEHNTTSGKGQNSDGRKHKDADGYERHHPEAFAWKSPRTSSHSNARKAASAMIARIPFPLARYIAAVYRPVA